MNVPSEPQSLLLLDPDPAQRNATAASLVRSGYLVHPVGREKAFVASLATGRFDAVLAALEGSPAETSHHVRWLASQVGRTPLIVLCDASRIRSAVVALQHGAEDYLLRPPDPVELKRRLARILERDDLDSKLAFFQDELSKRSGLANLETRSAAMRALFDSVMRVAPMRTTVLIYGESGVGKELVARAIHFNSNRREAPFVALNCAAIPAGLIESELFGHEKGSFTGAHARARGKFEIAHGGSLFLDEIGEMDPATQAKLLRVLEQREFMRLGGDRSVRVDVRVIAATNSNLEDLVSRAVFRRDLYYRLKVVTLTVPPLRERRGDLPALVRTFVEQLSRANAVPPKSLTPQALATLEAYDWPGNVRELKNVLESLIVSLPGDTIHAEDLPRAMRSERGAVTSRAIEPGLTLADMERSLIVATLEATGGNRTHSAAMLGIGVRTLQRKIAEYSLTIPSKRRRRRRAAGPLAASGSATTSDGEGGGPASRRSD